MSLGSKLGQIAAGVTSNQLALVNPSKPPAPPAHQAGDWACLTGCKYINNAINMNCKKCNRPKPDGAALASAVAAAIPGTPANATLMGFAAAAPVHVDNGSSSWARQFSADVRHGKAMFEGETDLPAWLRGADESEPAKKKRKKGSSSSSSSDSSGKKKADAKAKAKPAAKKKVKAKDAKYAGLSKEEKAKKKAEEEEAKRAAMRARRKDRVISLDD
eukprot:TRINITY_DN118794_c0_g1_i1.p1 TRINITY_DN118794_c0_g1~~TRINITY_DN118794_c0_g1_i1.p1  ORF type:complete len:245 (-),score=63.26 TRINITY_DN118794_c0_g1_i1:128-778(-)